jgi:hypothetical protein
MIIGYRGKTKVGMTPRPCGDVTEKGDNLSYWLLPADTEFPISNKVDGSK